MAAVSLRSARYLILANGRIKWHLSTAMCLLAIGSLFDTLSSSRGLPLFRHLHPCISKWLLSICGSLATLYWQMIATNVQLHAAMRCHIADHQLLCSCKWLYQFALSSLPCLRKWALSIGGYQLHRGSKWLLLGLSLAATVY
jgi:hypothetical protein